MIEALSVVAAAVLFALFGLVARGRGRPCGPGACACGAIGRRDGCARTAGGRESAHEQN